MGEEERRERWGEQVFAYLAQRRNDKTCILDFELKNALEAGEHVHMLDEDGEWCFGDCDVPMRPDESQDFPWIAGDDAA